MITNKNLAILKCDKCGSEYQITKKAFKWRTKNNYPNVCKMCSEQIRSNKVSIGLKKYLNDNKNVKEDRIKQLQEDRKKWYDSLSEDDKIAIINKWKNWYYSMSDKEKENFRKKLSNGLTDEIKEKNAKMHSEWYRNLSDDKRNEISKKLSNSLKTYWDSLDENERKLKVNKMVDGIINYWDNMTEEERLNHIKVLSNNIKNYWDNISDTDMEKMKKENSLRSKEYWKNISDDEKIIIKDKMSKNMNRLWKDKKYRDHQIKVHKEYWNSLSDEDKAMISKQFKEIYESLDDNEKLIRIQNMVNGNKKYWKNMTKEKRKSITKKNIINSNFKNNLHKKFESYFKESYISNDYYVKAEIVIINGNKSKSWDYGIYDKSNDKLVMVVDLDGAFTHADNCDYNGIHNREEYDERRGVFIPNDVKYNIIYELKFKQSFENMIKDLMIDYDTFVKNQFKQCRLLPDIPYPRYTITALSKSYNQLCRLKTNDKYHKSINLNNREGDRIINHFHHSIYSAKCKRFKYSPYEAWYNDELLMKVIKNRIIYVNTINPNKILQGFNISKIAQKVSVFSAGRAKLLISRYLSDYSTIFDPFSGFSGRMLGCISLNKQYIGQDISPIHINESKQILDFLDNIGIQYNVQLYQKNILQSNGVYECLFTCPPYSDKEQWLDVPIDRRSCDDWIDACLNRFKCKRYLFVVDNTEKYKNKIVDVITNRSHLNKNKEYVVMI